MALLDHDIVNIYPDSCFAFKPDIANIAAIFFTFILKCLDINLFTLNLAAQKIARMKPGLPRCPPQLRGVDATQPYFFSMHPNTQP